MRGQIDLYRKDAGKDNFETASTAAAHYLPVDADHGRCAADAGSCT